MGARIFARSGGAQPQPRGRHRHKRPQKRSDVGDRGVEERSAAAAKYPESPATGPITVLSPTRGALNASPGCTACGPSWW